jgi:hypothetical protein
MVLTFALTYTITPLCLVELLWIVRLQGEKHDCGTRRPGNLLNVQMEVDQGHHISHYSIGSLFSARLCLIVDNFGKKRHQTCIADPINENTKFWPYQSSRSRSPYCQMVPPDICSDLYNYSIKFGWATVNSKYFTPLSNSILPIFIDCQLSAAKLGNFVQN